MSFRQWLRQQVHRTDPVGDLARQMSKWPTLNKPQGQFTSLSRWRQYLRWIDAGEDALEALDRAFSDYSYAPSVDFFSL